MAGARLIPLAMVMQGEGNTLDPIRSYLLWAPKYRRSQTAGTT